MSLRGLLMYKMRDHSECVISAVYTTLLAPRERTKGHMLGQSRVDPQLPSRPARGASRRNLLETPTLRTGEKLMAVEGIYENGQHHHYRRSRATIVKLWYLFIPQQIFFDHHPKRIGKLSIAVLLTSRRYSWRDILGVLFFEEDTHNRLTSNLMNRLENAIREDNCVIRSVSNAN